MKTSELRKAFIDFFVSKDHYALPSHSLIPDQDKTLLWINCGMAPLKKYYSQQAIPPSPRMVNSQKSLRTNDIDNVGKTDRHHTMFEMLGNFSIGDYFKKETIAWAWEFLTQVVQLNPDKLYVTIHPEDDEAFDIWSKIIGLAPERIYRDEENFWEIGPGPCGPNSELYYDRGEKYGCGSKDCQPGCDCDRYLEVWNLVFTQYNREVDGSLTELPSKNIDTGMSLERLASVVQNSDSNYEIDIFLAVIKKIEQISSKAYTEETKVAMRIIADHVRTAVFAIADGAMPSNEGRGYIIRRLIRRAVRFGKQLNLNKPFLHLLVPTVVEVMSDHYDYLPDKQDLVKKMILSEEERFLRNLEDGEKLIKDIVEQLEQREQRIISGEDAFKLYDTYGFPLELTCEIAQENGSEVDVDSFEKAMDRQRERARKARKEQVDNAFAEKKFADVAAGNVFTGYHSLKTRSTIIALNTLPEKEAGHTQVELLLDETPFYAEAGGQVADRGVISGSSGCLEVTDVKGLADGRILHLGSVKSGSFKVGDLVEAQVDFEHRQSVRAHHTCTHLLHQALKNILGDHVNQAGSWVGADRLRFDFTHFQSLTAEELAGIQDQVNEKIFSAAPVVTAKMTMAEAVKDGAVALFGEKYGSMVRVVSIGSYSKELCGGTHLNNAAEAGIFVIISESSIGSGIRRIEAVAGQVAYGYIKKRLQLVTAATDLLKVPVKDLLAKINDLSSEVSYLNKTNNDLQQKLFAATATGLLDNIINIKGVPVLAVQVDNLDMIALRKLGDALKAKSPDLALVLGSSIGSKVYLMAMIGDRTVKEHRLHAGKIIKEISKICGGGGGGKPHMAQAGGKKPEALAGALERAVELITAQLN